MITKLFRFILLMQLILPLASHAQSEAVSNGLNWLKANQAADGSWSSTQSSSTDYYATVSVLDSLAAFGETTSTAYTNGLSWTRNALVEGTTYLALRVKAVAASGADATTDLNTLLSYYNAGYGWGGDTGHSTSTFHTAVGLQAVKAVSYSDLSISNTALAYLTNSQNADGGWGFSSDNPSNVYVTAITAATLQQFPQSSTIATAITKATTYLTIWQNPDGGFGTSPDGGQASTVFETALAYVALVGDGQTEGLPLQNALNYLVTTQSANGSWNDDPYSTALALKALHLSENKPAPPPPAATTGSVMGTVVDGATNAPLAGVSAVLAGDTSFTATSDAKGQFALSGIPAGGQQITLSYANYAPLTITAPISAGTFINVGKIGLSVAPTSGLVQGIVWDADDNAPYSGVTVQVQSGFYSYDAVSGADGSYRINNIPPGTLTVGTPSGSKAGYWNVPFTGTLAAGGIVIYSPLMSKTPPLTVNMTAQADKTTYKQGETVGLAFTLLNTRSLAYEALLNVRVTGPTGTSVYDTSVVVNLTANGTTMQNLSFALPPSAVNGFYTIKAELVDGSGIKKGTTSATFNLSDLRSQGLPCRPQGEYRRGGRNLGRHLLPRGGGALSSRAEPSRQRSRRRHPDPHSFNQQRRRSKRRQA